MSGGPVIVASQWCKSAGSAGNAEMPGVREVMRAISSFWRRFVDDWFSDEEAEEGVLAAVELFWWFNIIRLFKQLWF